MLLKGINRKFKKTRKTSILNSKFRNSRDYLFSITPHALYKFREENRAHIKVEGRTFGDYDLPEDIMEYFDQAQFYRWIASKNAEAMQILQK